MRPCTAERKHPFDLMPGHIPTVRRPHNKQSPHPGRVSAAVSGTMSGLRDRDRHELSALEREGPPVSPQRMHVPPVLKVPLLWVLIINGTRRGFSRNGALHKLSIPQLRALSSFLEPLCVASALSSCGSYHALYCGRFVNRKLPRAAEVYAAAPPSFLHWGFSFA